MRLTPFVALGLAMFSGCVRLADRPCSDDASCGRGEACADGFCELRTGGACHANLDCGAQGLCLASACTVTCATDAECTDGRTCDKAPRTAIFACLRPGHCGGDAECEPGFACRAGACEDQTGRDCESNVTCGNFARCVGGTCRIPCVNYSDCGAGTYCAWSSGFCEKRP